MKNFFFWCYALLFVGVTSVLLVIGYVWFTTTSCFSLKKIEVVGNKMLSRDQILKKSEIKTGENIFFINLNEVVDELKNSLCWIKDVSVKRVFPDKIRIEVIEKVPYYWIVRNSRLFYADRSGDLIAPVRRDKFVTLPVLRIDENETDPDIIENITELFLDPDLPFRFLDIGSLEVFFDMVRVTLPEREVVIELDRNDLSLALKTLKRIWTDLEQRKELKKVKRIFVYKRYAWVKWRN